MLKTITMAALTALLAPSSPVHGPNPVHLTSGPWTSGQAQTLTIGGCRPGDRVHVGLSIHGQGAGKAQDRSLRLLQPMRLGAGVLVGPNGRATLSFRVPTTSPDVSVWVQALNLSTGQSSQVLSRQISSPMRPHATPPLVPTVAIPAGSFAMGDHAGVGFPHELPVHSVTLLGFWMDKFELTNAAYVTYLNTALAGGEISVGNDAVTQVGGAGLILCDTWSTSTFTPIAWNGSTFSVILGREAHPVVQVNWYGACVYANWRSAQEGLQPCYDLTTWACDFQANGYRLPTEAEWEYAARGNSSTYDPYHWGNSIDGSHANFLDSGDPFDNSTTPVGYYDGNQIPMGGDMANAFGLYDMSGNVWEWCNDWYDVNAYSTGSSQNPTGPVSGTRRILRGGRWHGAAAATRSANRYKGDPINRISTFGIRLVSRH